MSNKAEVVKDLLSQYAPDLDAEIIESQGLVDSIPTWMVVSAETIIVAFPFLWKIFLVWLDRYANGKVTIKYKNAEDREIVVEYSRLNRHEVEKLIDSNQIPIKPSAESDVLIGFDDK